MKKILPSQDTLALIRSLIEKIRGIVHEEKLDQLALEELGKGVSGLYRSNSHAPNNSIKAFEHPQTVNYDANGFGKSLDNEILKINSYGWKSIISISECILKVQGIVNTFNQDTRTRHLSLFRGHTDESWTISSSIARNMQNKGISLSTATEISKFEINALRKWQEKIKSDKYLREEIFGECPLPNDDNASWWQLKQHYDDDKETGGSRLIDVTSSPLSALYFACAGWDGSIDESKNGMLWVLHNPPGRHFVDQQTLKHIDPRYQEWYDHAGETISDYFDFNHSAVIRTILTSPDNHRSIAQDGYFLYYPDLSTEGNLWTSQTFTFVIPAQFKKHILTELYSLGYTPEKMVRGHKGIEAKRRLEKELGIAQLS